VSLYKGQISQLTVNTEAGLVVISKIAENWLLAVLFPPNLSLGIAVVKTKATLLALRELDLHIIKTMPTPSTEPKPVPSTKPVTPPPVPPPQPSPTPASEVKTEEPPPKPTPAPATTPPAESIPPPTIPDTESMPPPMEPPPPEPSEAGPTPLPPAPEEGRIDLTFIPQGGEDLLAALDTGSPVGTALYDKFGPYARDVLFLVDGKRDVKTIAFLLGLPEYAIVDVLEFAISNRILATPASA
jgi:hypothetical protein